MGGLADRSRLVGLVEPAFLDSQAWHSTGPKKKQVAKFVTPFRRILQLIDGMWLIGDDIQVSGAGSGKS